MDTLNRLAALLTDETFFNPDNLLEEKSKFLVDNDYNPQFTYRKLDFDAASFRQELEQLLQAPQDPDQRVSSLVHGRARDLMKWLSLLEGRGSDDFTNLSRELFGIPDIRLRESARKMIADASVEDDQDKTITAKEAQERLQSSLDDLGPGWRAILDEALVSKAHINPQLHLLRIKADEMFSKDEVERLIVHEVGVHATRSYNGTQQPYKLFSAGTAGYLETEEGLATLNEEKNGLLSSKRKRELAARVLLIAVAQEKSFSETFKEACELVGDDDAFMMTVRAKRGLGDTSKPGGLTKDLLYLKGYLRVKALSDEDRKYLYIGKISYHQLPIIKSLVEEGKVTLP